MNKFVILLLNILSALCFLSCGTNNQDSQAITEIREAVDKVNDACPIYMDMGNDVTLMSVKYYDNKVVYDYKLNRINDKVTANIDDLKTGMLYMCKAEMNVLPENKKFYENIIKTGTLLVYYYHTDSGKSISIEMTKDDLESVIGTH